MTACLLSIQSYLHAWKRFIYYYDSICLYLNFCIILCESWLMTLLGDSHMLHLNVDFILGFLFFLVIFHPHVTLGWQSLWFRLDNVCMCCCQSNYSFLAFSFNDRIRDALLGGSPFGHPLQQGFVTGLFLEVLVVFWPYLFIFFCSEFCHIYNMIYWIYSSAKWPWPWWQSWCRACACCVKGSHSGSIYRTILAFFSVWWFFNF